MERSEYELLKARTAAKRDRAIEAAEAEYTRMVESLELVWSLAAEAESSVFTEMAEDRELGRRPNGEFMTLGPTAMVREAIQHLPHSFTMPNVAEVLERRYPTSIVSRLAISSALNKLWKQGEISQTRPGAGKAPALYEKVETAK